MLKKSSNPRRMPANYLLLFMMIQRRSPIHLSRRVSGIILTEVICARYQTTLLQNHMSIEHTYESLLTTDKSGDLVIIIFNMTSPGALIQKMLSRPIEHLIMRQKRLPNIEVLRLYRDVYKYAGKFDWYNEKGQLWKDIIRKSARKEFDLSRYETDPFLIMKMMVTTRECLSQLDEKLCSAHFAFVKTVQESKTDEQQFVRHR